MAKQILIDESLFCKLVYFHCLEHQDNEEVNETIKNELLIKMDKIAARQKYFEQLQKDEPFLDRK